jgi:hypothetical protein
VVLAFEAVFTHPRARMQERKRILGQLFWIVVQLVAVFAVSIQPLLLLMG